MILNLGDKWQPDKFIDKINQLDGKILDDENERKITAELNGKIYELTPNYIIDDKDKSIIYTGKFEISCIKTCARSNPFK